ncbi:MAG: hypothetical protein AB4352_08705 [Hormoscilla sp.]
MRRGEHFVSVAGPLVPTALPGNGFGRGGLRSPGPRDLIETDFLAIAIL